MNLIKRKSLAPALSMAVLALSFLLAVFWQPRPARRKKPKSWVRRHPLRVTNQNPHRRRLRLSTTWCELLRIS